MKILIVRPWGRTAFEMGMFCRDAFESVGHAADLFTYNDEKISSRFPFLKTAERNFVEKLLIKKISDFQPGFILVIKGDRIPLDIIGGIRKKFNIPVANYWIDDPHFIEVSSKLSPAYDYFFTNDPDCVRIHKEAGCPNVSFVTFGCAPELHRKIGLSEKERERYGSDICFAGTVSQGRLSVLESLKGFNFKIWSEPVLYSFGKGCRIEKKDISRSSPIFSNFTGHSVWGEELVKTYNASKIILNIHFPQTVPIMRDFEATGCGAFLLTDNARSLGDMFEYGKEIAEYEDAQGLKNAAEYYLSHIQERKDIAGLGQKRAHTDHTYASRVKEMLSFINGNTI